MFQDPNIGESIIIDGRPYVFIQVPDAPGVVYGEIGKKAKVYRVMQGTKAFALKVFKTVFRDPRIANTTDQITTYQTIPGLAVAQRTVLTPRKYPELINSHPEFSYAVLMPWIEGKSWVNYIIGKIPITRKESLRLATALVNIVGGLEERNMAHCDLSGGNFIFSTDYSKVELIDIEDLFGIGLPSPAPLPAGTSGYSPDWIKRAGLWEVGADRFAISILIGEILGWQFEDIRAASSSGDSYFAEGEYGHDSKRYNLILNRLTEIHPEIPTLFTTSWRAQNTNDCPRISEWKRVISLIPMDGGTLNWGWESLDLPVDINLPKENNIQPIKAVSSDFTKSTIEDHDSHEKKALICPACGKVIQAEWVECPYCRFDLVKKAVVSETPNKTNIQPKTLKSDNEPDVVAKAWPTKGGGGNLKRRKLTSIFLIFVALGVIMLFLILVSGSLIDQVSSQLERMSGWILTYTISNSFLALLVGGVYTWVFRHNIRKSKIWLFILASIIGGLIGGLVSGSIVQIGQIHNSFPNSFLIGAVIGFISGTLSSLGQNLFMKSVGMKIKWLLYNMISWLVIWSIGTTISWSINSTFGLALTATFIIIASGGALALFLNRYPDIEF